MRSGSSKLILTRLDDLVYIGFGQSFQFPLITLAEIDVVGDHALGTRAWHFEKEVSQTSSVHALQRGCCFTLAQQALTIGIHKVGVALKLRGDLRKSLGIHRGRGDLFTMSL